MPILKRPESLLATLVLTAIFSCSVPINANTNQSRVPQSVCEAVELAIGEDGLEITLEADYTSDGNHYSFFLDKKCPGKTLKLYHDAETVKNEAYHKFDSVDWEIEDPKVHVRVLGKIKWVQGSFRLYAKEYLMVVIEPSR